MVFKIVPTHVDSRAAIQGIERTLSRMTLMLVLLAVAIGTAGCSEDSSNPMDSDRVASDLIDRSAQVGALQGNSASLSPTATLAERYAAGLAEKDPVNRHQLLAYVYAKATAKDLDGMLGVIKENLRKRRPEEVRVFANLFAKLDKRTALGEVLSWEYPAANIMASEEVMSVWVQSGDSDAIRKTWAELEESGEIPPGRIHQGEMAMAGAFARYGDYDSLKALFANATEVDHRRRLIAHASQVMSQLDGESYLEFALGVHRGDELEADVKVEVVLQAVKLAALAPMDYTTSWYENIKDGPYSGDALSIIAQKWSRTEPVAALEFVRSRPASEKPEMAKRAVAIMWLKKDPQAAEPFLLEAIESDPSMSSVLLPLAQHLMARDLNGSMELAQRVPDSRERDSVLKQGLMRWVQRDEAAAEAFMAANPVSKPIESAVKGAKRLKEKRDVAAKAEAKRAK